MENRVFDLQHLNKLVENQSFEECDNYISSFFFKNGANIYFRNGYKNEFVLYKDTEAIKLIPADLVCYDKKTETYNAKKYLNNTKFKSKEYNPTIDFKTDAITFTKIERNGIPVNYLNMAKPKPEFNNILVNREEMKKDLDLVYTHIKTVWADEDEQINNWILNFLACSMTGKRKLRQCLYLPCNVERAGRGSILNFINNAIGERMYKTCSIEELLKYNKNFEGRSLINFDELPTDVGNFRSVSDTLKSLITEPSFPCRDMYNKAYSQKNTFNVIITSNNEAVRITQSNNSRYMICQINTCKVGDHKYFKTLNEILEKPEIQKLFYEDMEKRYETTCQGWNEDIKPFSSVKQEKLIETLPKVLKYLKDEFVLKSLGVEYTTKDFFETYYRFSGDKTSKQKLNKELEKVGIKAQKVRKDKTTPTMYCITHKELLKNYTKLGFIDENLEYVENDECDEEEEEEECPFLEKKDVKKTSLGGMGDNIPLNELNELKAKYDELCEKYEELLKKVEQPKKKVEQPKKKIVIKRKVATTTLLNEARKTIIQETTDMNESGDF